MPQNTLTFYTVVNIDSNPTETAVHTNISGEFQFNRTRKIYNQYRTEFIDIFMFIPSSYLSTLERGMKAVSSDGTIYKITRFERYQEHTEILLELKNA